MDLAKKQNDCLVAIHWGGIWDYSAAKIMAKNKILRSRRSRQLPCVFRDSPPVQTVDHGCYSSDPSSGRRRPFCANRQYWGAAFP